MEQIIPQFVDDFHGGVVIILSNYGVTDEWKKCFTSDRAAKNGNIGHVKLGQVLVLKRDYGLKKQHFIPLSPDEWMEKLFVCREHNKLNLDQWKILKRIDIPDAYKKVKNINWLYLTLPKNMRDWKKLQTDGCSTMHICDTGCYEHLPLNDSNFDCQTLDYTWFCSCGFDENDETKKVGVRGTFQEAIPSYLCCNNSNVT